MKWMNTFNYIGNNKFVYSTPIRLAWSLNGSWYLHKDREKIEDLLKLKSYISP